MPRYKKDINLIVTNEMAQAMIDKALIQRDKFLVAILYFSGARPDELLRLKKQDIVEDNGKLVIKLHTSKLGKHEGFLIEDRLLTMNSEMPFFDIVRTYWMESLGEYLLSISERRMEQVIENLSDCKLCPYNFRHSRLTKLARAGATLDQLMYWKGAVDTKSVAPYIRGKKVEFDKIE
jgi:integrase